MSEQFSRLSVDLLAHAEFLEQDMMDGLTQEEQQEFFAHQQLVKGIVKVLIGTREKIQSGNFTAFERLAQESRELVDSLLDGHYTLTGLHNVSSLVYRTMRLAQLQAVNTPSPQTNRYIQEAAQAYINGLALASVAMSRAALEQALKERLGRQADGRFIEFRDLIVEAGKYALLKGAGLKAAKDLAKKGNDVLHEKPVSEEGAFEILGAVRSLLEEIYSAQGG